jgi:hypothetical protein
MEILNLENKLQEKKKISVEDLNLVSFKEIAYEELAERVETTPVSALDKLLHISKPNSEEKDAHTNPLFRVVALKKKVADGIVGREDETAAVFAASVAGVPAVLIGEPGTAKSLLIRMINDGCTTKKFFDYLMNSYTQPDELFGAPKIEQLMKGKFERDIEGKLPEADFAFLDEIFRGGSHILNTLLSVINERKFHNGSEVKDLPLVNLFGAANAPPTDPDLGAFYDRFPIRILTESIFKKRGNGSDKDLMGKNLLEVSIGIERGKFDSRARDQEKKDAPACSNDFRFLRHYMLRSIIKNNLYGNTTAEKFRLAFYKLRDLPMKYSDRTFSRLFTVGLAHNFLETGTCKNPKWEHLKMAFLWTADSHQQREAIEHEIEGIQSDMHNGSE